MKQIYLMILIVLLGVSVACNKVDESSGDMRSLGEFLIEDCAKTAPVPGSNNENIIMTYNIALGDTGYALIDYIGEGASIILYKYFVKEVANFNISGSYEGELAISNGMGINHVVDGEQHIYFSNINTTHWLPDTDEVIPFDIEKIIFYYDGGKVETDVAGKKGYIAILPNEMTNFAALDKNGDTIWNYETFIKNGYKVEQSFLIKPERD
jgi:hypothetical protein